MGVDSEKDVHYELISENTNAEVFSRFMKKLVGTLGEEERKKTIIILYNLSTHLTLELFEYYKLVKIKDLFNTPYLSKFSMIEYCFCCLKNITYKKIYKNINELKKIIKFLIDNGYLNRQINKLINTINN